MSPMVTIARDLDDLIKESGADKINLAYSKAEYDESFENIKFGLIASSMQKAKYNGCSFENCEFSGLNMKHAKFDDVEFVDCDFGLAQLDGVTAQNSSFYGDDVYFTGASMVHADFSWSSFACAGFNRVNASWAYFVKSDLRKADFSGANLFGVSFVRADLRGANFTGANLRGADLRGADFTNAQLDGAQFDGAIIDDSTKLPAEYRN